MKTTGKRSAILINASSGEIVKSTTVIIKKLNSTYQNKRGSEFISPEPRLSGKQPDVESKSKV